ncbi:UDP binding domain-containing protein, partial [Winogradskyella sp.]|uniref:UDP binding domain-containing protein n=1 Tax=Winogradskyella sp. TaxID=1883156 RepID=UPI00260B3CDB
GGSCFPKDVKALKKTAEKSGYKAQLLNAVEDVNDRQKLVIAEKVIERFGENLTGMTFAVWGLAFKPGTDDMREAPSIYIIKKLIEQGAKINAYDPKAIHEAQEFYLKGVPNVIYTNSKYKALYNADAMLLLTEWKEFRSPDFMEIKNTLNAPIIFDGRNQYNDDRMEELGFEYHQIGKKN